MDENFAYWSASFQRAGKWFSLSLALGTDVVADITDRLPSDMPCLHDHARRLRLPTFNPHSGPITHSSTGSKPDSPVHPLFPKLFLTCGLVCNSRATFWWDHQFGIRRNTYSHCSKPLSHFRIRQRTIAYAHETSHGTYLLCSRYCLKFQFEGYLPPPSLMLSTR